MTIHAQRATDALCEHAEGPVWAEAWGGLRWVDMLRGDVMRLDPESHEVTRWHTGKVAAALRPRANGGLVLAAEHEFLLFDSYGGSALTTIPVLTDPRVRFNDGACDPDGAFLCGSMAYAETMGSGSLYKLSPDGRVATVLTSVSISNGLAFGPGNDTAFYTDTTTGRVDRFDWSSAAGLHNRRPFVQFDSEVGAPDGLCVDAEGGVWVALWGGSAVRRYSPEGVLDAVITLPVTQVTACTFGGPDLTELYITTSRYGLDPASQPDAGALFVATPGVRGIPALGFAG